MILPTNLIDWPYKHYKDKYSSQIFAFRVRVRVNPFRSIPHSPPLGFFSSIKKEFIWNPNIQSKNIKDMDMGLYLYSDLYKNMKKTTKNPFVKNTFMVWNDALCTLREVPNLS